MNAPMQEPREPGRADLIILNGRIATQITRRPFTTALAVKDGKFLRVDCDSVVLECRGPHTRVVDVGGRTVIPGLIDSHIHAIRGGLNFNMELRWDGVPSLSEALRMLREQARVTPAPQWVRVVGGWNEYQFEERRLPTLAEINLAAPDTPVFVLHLYDRAILNAAALRAVGYSKDTPDPHGGEIQRDSKGNPTGMLVARPNAGILYATLAKGPRLRIADQINSSRWFMRELNRLAVTSVIDAGGGFQAFPEDYQVIEHLRRHDQLTVRIAYNLFTQNAGKEVDDFSRWVKSAHAGDGDEFLRLNGAGEMLVFSAADFEDFVEPRPELSQGMEQDLEAVVRLLVENRWPFRLHATYDQSIGRFLDVFEKVNRDTPFDDLHWFFDHCETISERSIERVKALGGGIAIQHRMAYQGEYFIQRYGTDAAERTPPVRTMLAADVPVGAGTDATRVASYNPFIALYWLVSGRTVGGTEIYPPQRRLDRAEALRLYTIGSAWFSNEAAKKGSIHPGQYADFAVLSENYFEIPEQRIKQLESLLTVVDGRVVYASANFSHLAPPPPPISPDWSPVASYGGYYRQARGDQGNQIACHKGCTHRCRVHGHGHGFAWRAEVPASDVAGFWGVLGCNCFAF